MVTIDPFLYTLLPASVLYLAPRDTITRGALTFSAALVLFDAIPTCRVSKHNSVGLILLQRRSSDAVPAQCRSIPKCAVKTSAVIITVSELRRCSCAASLDSTFNWYVYALKICTKIVKMFNHLCSILLFFANVLAHRWA